MLNFHLNQETDLASHRFEAIDQIVKWIDSQLAMYVGAMFMAGWTILLAWGAIKPVERRDLLGGGGWRSRPRC